MNFPFKSPFIGDVPLPPESNSDRCGVRGDITHPMWNSTAGRWHLKVCAAARKDLAQTFKGVASWRIGSFKHDSMIHDFHGCTYGILTTIS